MNVMQKTCCYIMGELFLVERLMILSQSLAKTVLRVMISCMFRGPTFIWKILPISKSNLSFLCELIKLTIDAINHLLGVVKVFCDDNKNPKLLLYCLIQTHSNHS